MKLATEWENFSLHPATFYDAGDARPWSAWSHREVPAHGAELDPQLSATSSALAGDKLAGAFSSTRTPPQYPKVFGQ